MSLNPKNIDQLIDRYYSGKMTHQEMHQLEKAALSDPFLKDAMEGYSEVPGGLTHFKGLSDRFRSRYKYWAISILSVALLIMTTLYFTKEDHLALNNETKAIPDQISNTQPVETSENTVIEVIPSTIETMVTIEPSAQIRSKQIKNDFSTNQTYHIEEKKDNDTIVLADPNDLVFEEEIPEIITTHKESKIVVYPYRYFYDLAVVDYSRFENREKIINKTVYTLSGLDASFESETRKNEQELIEQTVKVSYLNYLEETLYYFSKDRYKNALKRLNVISSQYKNDLNAMFYGGLCYYNLTHFKEALENFNAILKLKTGPFTEEAQWYKAKTLIKLERNSEAKTLLADIILLNGFYKDQASETLKNLK